MDDQTEISATRETIRKDMILAKLSLRLDKVLKNEVYRLNAEQNVFDKRYCFEKNHYETKLRRLREEKQFSTARVRGLVVNRDEMRSNANRVGMKRILKRRNFLEEMVQQTSCITRRDLKWSLNDQSQSKFVKVQTASLEESASSSNDKQARRFPGITHKHPMFAAKNALDKCKTNRNLQLKNTTSKTLKGP